MNIDEAKLVLKIRTKPEYHKYIKTDLAGDFAVEVASYIKYLEATIAQLNVPHNSEKD